MSTKIVILLLLGISFLFFGCAKKGGPAGPAEVPVDGEVNAGEQPSSAKRPVDTEVEEEPTTGQPSSAERPVDTEEEVPPSVEPEDGNVEAINDPALANLFNIDTDKPMEDEGFGIETPGSE